MVNFDTSFGHNLFKIAIGNRISDIAKHRVQNDAFRILAAFEGNPHVPILTFKFSDQQLTRKVGWEHRLLLLVARASDGNGEYEILTCKCGANGLAKTL
jgi:hypothetical protein|tara:strand:+ start:976 stop:1272 length:297 start_codon:yes stop_codon:yes gene_type:complete